MPFPPFFRPTACAKKATAHLLNAFLVAVLWTYPLYGEETPEWIARELYFVQEASSPQDLTDSIETAFSRIPRSERLRLHYHPDEKIALHAGWNSFLDNMHVVSRFPGDDSKGLPLRSLALSRWIGFVEGRLNEPVPEAWHRTLEGGMIGIDRDMIFLGIRQNFGFIPDKNRFRDAAIQVAEKGEAYEISDENFTLSVRKDLVEISATSVVTAKLSDTGLSVVCVSHWPQVNLFAFRDLAPEPVWQVSYSDGPMVMLGGEIHEAHSLQVSDEFVTVFSANSLSCGIQRWKAEDGKYAWGFTTSFRTGK